jgi:hypothetical protein
MIRRVSPVLEITFQDFGAATVSVNLAFRSGWSNTGNAVLASEGTNSEYRYSDPSSLSTYRVIADPLVNIGEVKSNLMTFSPAFTPSRKIRCSFDSSKVGPAVSVPPAVAGGAFISVPFNDTFDTEDRFSLPLIFRQSSTIGGISPPATAGGTDTLTLISIVPFNTGDIFSSVRFSLYRTSEYRLARHSANAFGTPASIGGCCEKCETVNIKMRIKESSLVFMFDLGVWVSTYFRMGMVRIKRKGTSPQRRGDPEKFIISLSFSLCVSASLR